MNLGTAFGPSDPNLRNSMLVDTIRAELTRLQLHAVNLNVSSKDDGLVKLQGSLLQYWKLPPCLDGQWLLAELRGLPDAAGPEAVMSGLAAAYDIESNTASTSQSTTQLRLFDPQSTTHMRGSAAVEKES